MDHQNETRPSAPRSPEKKSGGFFWYGVGILVFALLLGALLTSKPVASVPFAPQFQQLVKTNETIADVGTKDKPLRVKYSNPRDLVVSEYRVSGKVDRVELNAEGEPTGEPAEALFRTNILNLASETFELLSSNNVPFTVVDGPSPWAAWAPGMVFLIVMLMLFFTIMRRMGFGECVVSIGSVRDGVLREAEDRPVASPSLGSD